MKLWIDDIRSVPDDGTFNWIWCRSVNSAKKTIQSIEELGGHIRFIDIDHDAGDYANDGGDYIRILDWLEETGRNYPIKIHSQNPVGVQNMRRIIEKNGWKEVK